MNPALRAFVRSRAAARCEYCHWPEPHGSVLFCVDHIVARKHHGLTVGDNLAWACLRCNAYKGDNLAGVDPMSGAMVRLFHPRNNVWGEHFGWEGPELLGLSDVGRATIDVLSINDFGRIEMRMLLLSAGIAF